MSSIIKKIGEGLSNRINANKQQRQSPLSLSSENNKKKKNDDDDINDTNQHPKMMNKKMIVTIESDIPKRKKKTLKDVYYDERTRAMRYNKKESMVPSIMTITADDADLVDLDDTDDIHIDSDDDSDDDDDYKCYTNTDTTPLVTTSLKRHHSTSSFHSSSLLEGTTTTTIKLKRKSIINNTTTTSLLWNDIYIPKPAIDQSTILLIGGFFFIITQIYTPILIILFLISSYVIPYCIRENDMASSRRQLFKQFLDCHNINQQSSNIVYNKSKSNATLTTSSPSLIKELTVPEEFCQLRSSSLSSTIQFEQSYWTNARGMLLNTVMLTPPNNEPIQSIICYCHGYTDNISYTKLLEFQRFVQYGNIAVIAIEYEGHGLSDGLFGYIENWNHIIDDVSSYFTYILHKKDIFHNKPTFLMGESMGGAIAYDVYDRVPHLFQQKQQPYGSDTEGSSVGGGVIFLCPMCKISDDMMPSPIVIDCIKRLLEVIPWLGYLPIAPTGKSNIENVSYKIREKYHIASYSPLNYSRKPRLSTARELLDTTIRISDTFTEFNASFLIIHGKDDIVTDPLLSKQLYNESKSIDKTIHLYDNMWHSLLSGETDENINHVTNDIIQWIKKRS